MGAALVTGASSGIGWEIAKLFAEDRKDLVLVARNRKKLEQLARDLTAAFGVSVRVMVKDLSDPRVPPQIFAELAQVKIEIDALINNAGFGVYGPFARTGIDKELDMIEVNVKAVTHLTKLALPGMLGRKKGRILNVASTAAFQPGPLMAVYYATKAYVLSFSEALANELKASGVTVTCLCPGPTETGFQERAALQGSRLVKLGMMSAQAVAADGYRGMLAGKPVVISGLRNWLVAESVRFAPRRLVTAVSRKVAEKT